MDPEDGLGQLSKDGNEINHVIRSKIEYIHPRDGTNMALELFNAFKQYSDKVLLVDTANDKQWTGAQLLDQVGRVATGLVQKLQIKPNDIVMTICDHTGQEILAALGLVLAGAALYGTTPKDGYTETKILCELVKPNLIIVSGRLHATAIALRQNVKGMQETRIVWTEEPQEFNGTSSEHYIPDENNNVECNGKASTMPNAYSVEATKQRDQVVLFKDLLEGPLDLDLVEDIVTHRIKPREHTLTYMLTSGSTGRPKVVPSTHEQLVHGLYSMISAARNSITTISTTSSCDVNKNPFITSNGNHTKTNGHGHLTSESGGHGHLLPRGPLLPMDSSSVVSGDLPLDHGAGLNTMFLALYLGAKYVVMPSYEEETFWQAVSDYKITMSIASTTFGYKLFACLKKWIDSRDNKTMGANHQWDLSSFKFIACAGAKMAFIDVIREVTQVYPHIKVAQSYGCTEIGFISMVHQDESHTDYLSSTGYLFPGLLANIVDRDNESQVKGPGEQPGELLIWARSKFKGYRCHRDDDPAKIYALCHDANGLFYKTGDQAHWDEDGRIYIHGRFKDTLFLMEDWKILPVELEDVINEHPLVEMSAVIGIPDKNLPGCHAPRAFVKLKSLKSAQVRQLELVDAKLVAKLKAREHNCISRDIYEFVAGRTARPKHLTGGVRIVDEFPRVGLLNKVDRKALHLIGD